jgi:hypothetical protein
MKLGIQTPVPRQAHAAYEPTDPKNPRDARWDEYKSQRATLAWGDTDTRYLRHALPDLTGLGARTVSAWRGERVSAQAVLASPRVMNEVRVRIEGIPFASARFVRFVRADEALIPDVLDDAESVTVDANTTRSIWVSVEPPPGTRPGRYEGTLHAEGGRTSLSLPLVVEVLPRTLPPPAEWKFYLDLWQNPYAVSRWHRVKPFSDEHLRLMRPHLRLLADAGQKVLTATLLHEPWGGQTFDPYGSMIDWGKAADGSWRWDFSLFDRYVAFGKSCGIGPYVNVYSMIPWTNKLRFRNERGEYEWLSLEPGKPGYEAIFAPFLKEFSRHLKQKGWLGTTRIAMDERPLPVMKAAFDVVRRHAPQIPIALAGEANPEFQDFVEDWCLMLGDTPPALLAARRKSRRPTTFYVCCVPNRPNTFTDAPPAESHWIGLWAAAKGYGGFLRWAYDSWTEDPFFDTKHTTWPAGDCFLVYPGARSSIRFERLREGIQDFEKLRILREARVDVSAVDAALAKLTRLSNPAEEATPQVNAVRAALLAVSG